MIKYLLVICGWLIGNLYIQANEINHEKLSINAMTYNIRVPVDTAPNDWQSRKSLAWQVIENRQPDVIGFQEMVASQREYLLAKSSLYKVFGDGRDANRTGESCTIFYRHDKWFLDQNESGTFWYSSSPNIAGSMDWGNEYIRIATWVRLINKESGQGIYVFNTHWDFLDDFQLKAVSLLTQSIAARKYQQEPYIVMGDLNALPNSKAVINLLKSDSAAPLADAWLSFQQTLSQQGNSHKNKAIHNLQASNVQSNSVKDGSLEDSSGFTFHGFSGQASRRIDYIFSSTGVSKIENIEVIKDQDNGYYPTDHFPVLAELTF